MGEINTGTLPKGWELCCFGDIASIRNGYAFKSDLFKKSKEKETDVPLIRQSQMKGARIDTTDAVFLSEEYLKKHSNFVVTKGDIIIGMSGSIGKVCLYDEDSPALQNQRTGKIVPHLFSELNPKFFGLFLSNIERDLTKYAKGMAVQNISAKDIEQVPFNLPPQNEQHRIVAKIEELFSELDKGIESLKTARAQLKIYRQALLKNAFEGKLTADWRAKNQNKLESTDALLKRIQTERAKHHAEQLAKWEAAGKQGSKPKAPKALPPLTADELAGLPELPQGWGWVKVAALASKITDGEHFRPKVQDRGIYFLSAKDIQSHGVVFTDPLFIDEKTAEKARSRCDPERGDVLIVSRGATVGRMCTVDTDDVFCLLGSVILIKIFRLVRSRYFLHGLKSPLVNKKIIAASGATAQQAIYLRDIQHVPMPLCSFDEQLEIEKILDEKFSGIDAIELAITTELLRSDALRQSILKKAFSGQLVAQDPSDEPAAALLARIKKEAK